MSENHIALYRKYRPSNFDSVIGQDHIVKAIGGALKSGKIGHAYILCGPRGTGKTTIARIIARELGTSPHDIYELDAASNRGIDEMRSLRENVNTLPFDSKYKVYILDEVHMLTGPAWNAILKTLEEPPAHVVFILATTELDKVPDTIISRCQTFIFKKPSDSILVDVINSVAKAEGYSIEEGGAELLALVGDGSFRDTLSILDKVISFAQSKKVLFDDIVSVTGAPSRALVEDFISSLAENDLDKGMKAIMRAKENNIDVEVYLKMILSHLRYALMLRYAPKTKDDISSKISVHDLDFLIEIVSKKPEHISSNTLSILLETYQALHHSFIATLPLELALIKILNGSK